MDHSLIQTKSASPNKVVHQMATHLSYTHANLGHVTVAEIVKHSRPVLVVDINTDKTHSWMYFSKTPSTPSTHEPRPTTHDPRPSTLFFFV